MKKGVWIVFVLWSMVLFLAPFNRAEPLILWMLPAILSFFAYYFLVGRWEALPSFRVLFFIGLTARLVFLANPPGYSEDIYRYEWDAKMMDRWGDPYSIAPADTKVISSEDSLLLSKLNSKEYHSVYPPVLQGIFYLEFSVSKFTGWPFHLVHRGFLILIELLLLLLLRKFLMKSSLDKRMSMVYFLHPMVILEFSGNGHSEPWMILFILISLVFFFKNRIALFSLFTSLAIGIKFLPVLAFPAIYKSWNWKKAILPILLTALFLFIFFLPFLSFGEVNGLGNSLGLFFQKFEFNAGLYYVVREFFYLFTGFNVIYWLGPSLALAFLGLVLLRFFRSSENLTITSVFKEFELLFILFFLFGTTVHPWYLATPLVFSVITQSRYSSAWMGLSFLSYVHYSDQEEWYPLFVFMEYFILVIVLLKEGYFSDLIWVSSKKSSEISS